MDRDLHSGSCRRHTVKITSKFFKHPFEGFIAVGYVTVIGLLNIMQVVYGRRIVWPSSSIDF